MFLQADLYALPFHIPRALTHLFVCFRPRALGAAGRGDDGLEEGAEAWRHDDPSSKAITGSVYFQSREPAGAQGPSSA